MCGSPCRRPRAGAGGASTGGRVGASPPAAPCVVCARGRDPLRFAFVGQSVERKGLPVLLRAFEALREHIPSTLHVVGVTGEELAPLMLDDTGVVAVGKCSGA